MKLNDYVFLVTLILVGALISAVTLGSTIDVWQKVAVLVIAASDLSLMMALYASIACDE